MVLWTELCILVKLMHWSPKPNVTALGDRSFREVIKVKWGHKGEARSHRANVLIRRWRDTRTRTLSLSVSLSSYVHTEERPSEDTVIKQPSTSQEKRPHQTPVPTAPWPWTSSLQICEKIHFCCFSHSICGILLWPPKQTNTHEKSNGNSRNKKKNMIREIKNTSVKLISTLKTAE